MAPLTLLFHVLNFLAPALAMALAMPLVGLIWQKKTAFPLKWWTQFAIVFAASALALIAGLVILGRDGKMATYLGLVLTAASTQWVLGRGWR
jgi:hypothetical protein